MAFVQPMRRVTRMKCVSGVIPGMPKALPSTTLAVLRPTPGRLTSSSRVPGTCPSNSSTICWLKARIDSVLLRKKPVGRTISSTSARSAAAIAVASGKRANRAGVTRFTRLSVDWALSTVATRSSKGVVKSSSQRASG